MHPWVVFLAILRKQHKKRKMKQMSLEFTAIEQDGLRLSHRASSLSFLKQNISIRTSCLPDHAQDTRDSGSFYTLPGERVQLQPQGLCLHLFDVHLFPGKAQKGNRGENSIHGCPCCWEQLHWGVLGGGVKVCKGNNDLCKETVKGREAQNWKAWGGVEGGGRTECLSKLVLWPQDPWQAMYFWGSSLFILGKMQPPVSKRKVFKRLIKSTQKAFWTSNSS